MGRFEKKLINRSVIQVRTPGDVYVYLVVGEETAALIDTGCGIRGLKAYIEALTDKPVIVIATHGHPDHIGGAYEFDEVYLSKKDWEIAGKGGEIQVRKRYLQSWVDQGLINESEFIKKQEKYLPLEKEQIFDLGGITIQALEMPGHTKGQVVILIREFRMLILGDACNSAAYLQLPESTTISEYKENLLTFLSKYEGRYDTVLYSHPHNFGGKEIIPEMISLCDEIIGRMTDDAEWPIFKKGVVMAKTVDQDFHRKDGKIANIVYKKDCIQ